MVQRYVVELVDDFDPSQRATQTVTFSVGKRSYRLDLTDENAERFHDALEPYIKAAQRVSSQARQKAPATASGSKTASFSGQVRAWALDTGRSVNMRGRVPLSLQAEYLAAHPDQVAP